MRMRHWATVSVLGLAVVVLVVITLFSRRVEHRAEMRTVPSVYNSTSYGMKYLYDALSEVGYDTSVLNQPLSESLPKHLGVLLLPSPRAEQFSKADLLALKRWIVAGNTVIYLFSQHVANRSSEFELFDMFGMETYQSESKSFFRSFFLKANITPLLRHPFWNSVVLVKTDSAAGVRFDMQAPWLPLAQDDSKDIRIWMRRVGKGVLILSDSDTIFSNTRIASADNLRFLLNIVAARGANQVLFSEYYFHTDYDKTIIGMIQNEGFFLPLFQFLIGIMVLLIALWPRMGDSIASASRVVHTEAPDYIHAFATLANSKSKDKNALIKMRILACRDRLAYRLGLHPSSPERFFEQLIRRYGRMPELEDLRQIWMNLQQDGSLELTLYELNNLCSKVESTLTAPKT